MPSIFILTKRKTISVSESVGENMFSKTHFSATTINHPSLEAVYIYFDTSTYDEIKRDVKVSSNRIWVNH